MYGADNGIQMIIASNAKDLDFGHACLIAERCKTDCDL